MKTRTKILIGVGAVVAVAVMAGGYFFPTQIRAFGASVYVTVQGGTGTSSPSGILYGDGTSALKTVITGSNCTFIAGTFNCTGGGGSGSGTVSTSTALASGQVDFSTGVSTIGNDSNFLWDNTAKLFSVLTNATTSKLSSGQAWFGETATSSFSKAGALTLASALTVANGGTGAATLTGLLSGNGTSAFTATANGTNGQILAMSGAVPTWVASTSVAAGTGISVSANGTVTTVTNSGVISVGNGTGTTCTGTNPASCSLAAIAANSVLANSTGGSSIPVAVATSSLYTGSTGSVAYFSATNNLIGTSTVFLDTFGNVGIGTLTPTAVNANGHLTVAGISSQDIIASTTDNTTLSDAIFNAYAPGSRLFFGAHGTNQIATRYGITLGGWGEIGAFNSSFNTTNGLIIGTNPAVPLVLGTNNVERLRILSNGNIGVGTTTPQAIVNIASTTGPQLLLSDGINNTPPWFERAINGSFYLGTSSPSTFATSSVSALAINTNGQFTLPFYGGSTGCAQFNSAGVLSNTGSACGTGGGGSGNTTWELNANGLTGFLAPTTTQKVWIGQASSTMLSVNGPAYFGATATSSFSTAGALTLATPLLVASGGSGAGTLTGLLSGNGTSAFTATANGTNGQVLAMSAGIPTWVATSTAGTGLTYTATGAGVGNIALSVPISVANGGTNQTSYAANIILTSNAAGTSLVATSSNPLYVSSINATSTTLFNGFFGTSSPYAALSINAPAMGTAPYIAIGSTTGEVYRMSASAFAIYGMGTDTPKAMFAINPTALLGTNNAFAIGSSSASFLVVDNGGKIFAPNTTSSGSNQTGYWCYDGSGQLIRDTTVCLVSALKFKKDVQTLTEVGLPDLLSLRPVSYHYKDTSFGKNLQIGLIADEVASSSPFLNETLVAYDSQGAVHGFNYETFTALITKSIQDFYKEFQTLVARVSGLEKKQKDQDAKIKALEDRISKLENK